MSEQQLQGTIHAGVDNVSDVYLRLGSLPSTSAKFLSHRGGAMTDDVELADAAQALVLRILGNGYVTRADVQPLVDALGAYRERHPKETP